METCIGQADFTHLGQKINLKYKKMYVKIMIVAL